MLSGMDVARMFDLGEGPMYDVVEIVQLYQPNAQCMHSAYKFYP